MSRDRTQHGTVKRTGGKEQLAEAAEDMLGWYGPNSGRHDENRKRKKKKKRENNRRAEETASLRVSQFVSLVKSV